MRSEGYPMPNRRNLVWILLALFALILLALSVGCLGLALAASLLRSVEIEQREMSAIFMAGSGLLGAGMAIVLLLSGLEVWLGRPSPVLYPRRAWITLLGILSVSVAGGFLLANAGRFGVGLVPFHVALIVAPAMLFTAFVFLAAGHHANVSRRQAVLLFTSGAFSTLPAIVVELFGLLFSGMIVLFGAVFVPGGLAELERLMLQLEQWSLMTPEALTEDVLMSLLASPIVLAVAFLALAVVTPFVEEVCKTAALVVVGFRRHPRPLQAFLWGVAAGIGFAVIEGVLNSAMSLTDTATWAAGIGSRVPATAMHAFASGLIGLGWGYFWEGKKRWLLPLCYSISILFHGLWNFSVIAVAGAQSVVTLPAWLSGGTSIVGVLVVSALAIVAVLGGIGLPALLRRRQAQV